MLGILTFIGVFGILVLVHEWGHFYFAKKSGILVREFAIGMGPKLFSHIGQDGTAYTIRLLPVGGYVRMAGWGDDKTEIKTGTPANLTLNQEGKVVRINLSQKHLDTHSLPMTVLSYDLEDALEITGLVLEETKTYPVSAEATIVESDGTEIRIAPLNVQYQNASIWGRLMTNFAGPMNNFILGTLVFIILVFSQGGVSDLNTNHFQVMDSGALALAGFKTNDQILALEGYTVENWGDLTQAIEQSTKDFNSGDSLTLTVVSQNIKKDITVIPKEENGHFYLGVKPMLKSGFADKLLGGFQIAWDRSFLIINALKELLIKPNLNKLGGPVAMYQMTSMAASSGFLDILELMGMLSLNLGIFNLIPIPALDGGKIMINLLEAIRKKPLKQETEAYITLFGVAVMVLLMIAVTWNDILRTFF